MGYHNDPECFDPDGEELHELTTKHFDAIKASILAGETKDLDKVYDRLDDWLVGSSRAQTSAVIRDTLAGGKSFQKLMDDLVWAEALSRAEPEQLADKEDRRQAAEDDRIAWHIESRAA